MTERQQITIQALMDRFRAASCDLFNRYFDDEFVADRFGWVEEAMFLVMVLNYLNLSGTKPFYPELGIHPHTPTKAAVQGDSSRIVELSEADLLHYVNAFDDSEEERDLRWVRARVAAASEASLVGEEVVLDYSDCRFLGSVAATEE